MLTKALFLLMSVFAFNAHAEKLDVEVSVHNPCRPQNKQCFLLDVYLNGVLSASWTTSPGNPANNKGFKGTNTPEYTSANFTSANEADYESHREDPMPYAMHINNTGYAVHGSSLAVDGTKKSHGCVRLKTPNAKQLNEWVKQAMKSGGLRTITVRDTKVEYSGGKGQSTNYNEDLMKKLSPQVQKAIKSGQGGLF
jgi:hypothetical protein